MRSAHASASCQSPLVNSPSCCAIAADAVARASGRAASMRAVALQRARQFLVALLMLVCLFSALPALAQVGVGFTSNGTYSGTIGNNKGTAGPIQCPPGTVLRGVRHTDKSMTATNASTRGMTSQVSLYCARINITPGDVVQLQNVTPDGTPTVDGFAYPQPGTVETGYCPAGQIVHQFAGFDRDTSTTYPAWASSVQIACRPISLNAADWVQVDTSATASVDRIGVNESNAAHDFRGYFCPVSSNSAVSGIYRQAGGEGYDGINVYCGTILQARHSAILTFSDFAWDQTRGGAGWLVNLTRNGTLLNNLSGMSGENKIPYTVATDNVPTDYQSESELYVLPGPGYGAAINRRPAGIAANTYVTSETCGTGVTPGNMQDMSCSLSVAGLPDIAVELQSPPSRYSSVGESKNLTVTATNMGPGDVSGADGFALAVELPTGWTPNTITNCTVSGQILTCPISSVLAAAPSPGANGGQVSFTFPATTNADVASGTKTAQATLQRAVPDGDGDPTNNDYNTDNDIDVAPLVYLAGTPSLGIQKITRGGAGSFTFSGNNGWTSQTITTTQNERAGYGDVQVLAADGVATTITETLPPNWALSSVNCVGMAAGGTVSVGTDSFTLSADAIAPDSEIFCTVVNDTPEMQVTKTSSAVIDANGDGRITAGDTIEFSIEVKNIGPITISNITIDDPLLGISGAPLSPSSLAAGESATAGPYTYTLTQQDIYAGKVENVAIANGTDPDGTSVTDEGSTTTTFVGSAELTLQKTMSEYVDTDGNGRREAGDVFTYTFNVRNTGGVRLTGVYIDDPKLGIGRLDVTPADLDPDETGTATASYTLAQEDVDAGYVNNVATVHGTSPAGEDVSRDALQTEPIPPVAELELTKTAGAVVDANGNGRTDAGDTITYSFSVENTGTVTITNVTVDDARLGLTSLAVTPDSLAPGATGTASAAYTLTQADIDAGSVSNTAIVRGEDPDGGNAITDEASVSTEIDARPALTLTKMAGAIVDANGDGKVNAGDTLSYTFSIENSGAVTLAGLTIDDAKLGLSDAEVTPSTLAPGETGTSGPHIYTLTQADMDAGQVENSATGRGTAPCAGDLFAPCEVVSDDASVTTPVDGRPALTLTKTAGTITDANGNGRTDAGDTIAYSFSVENSGAVTLSAIAIDDAKLGLSGAEVTPSTLAPGETGTSGPHIYTLTQADIDAGKVDNSAVASATPQSGGDPVTGEASVTTPVTGVSGLTLTKTAGAVVDANGNGLTDAGDTIDYSLRVRNSGNVTLTSVTVDDAKLGVTGAPVTPDTLEPGAEGVAGPFTYRLTQADIDAGKVDNSASAKGKGPDGSDVTGDASVTTPVAGEPKIELTKTAGTIVDANGDGKVNAGDTITYSFEVENTGSVTISNVAIDDAKLGITALAVDPGTLAPGEKGTTSAIYTLTQADIDAGRVDNSASAKGKGPDGGDVTGAASVSTPIAAVPQLTLTKTAGAIVDANGNGRTDAGDTIAYTLTVENTGSVTMSDITVTDAKLGIDKAAVSPSTLAPSATGTAGPFTYVLTQADLDAGKVDNNASTSGKSPDGSDVTDTASVTTPVVGVAGITIEKIAGEPSGQTVGSTISYSFRVTNTGSIGLTGVTVADALPGVVVSGGPVDLAPGAVDTTSFTATYQLTQEDLNRGEVVNSATASGNPANGGDAIISDAGTATVKLNPRASLTVVKKATPPADARAGQLIAYAFEVTNTGDVDLTDIRLSDTLEGVVVKGGPIALLKPGETDSTSYEASYALTQADIDRGEVTNTATATGVPASGGDPVASDPAQVITPIEQKPGLALVKTGTIVDADGNGAIEAGDTLVYSFEVTNIGNVTVTDVQPIDAGPTFNGQRGTGTLGAFEPGAVAIAPGASQIFTATYTLTQADVDAAAGLPDAVANTATGRGYHRGGAAEGVAVDTAESRSRLSLPAAAPSDVTITKQAGLRMIRRGERAPFIIKVTNNANRTVSGLQVVDRLPPGFRYVEGSASIDGREATGEQVVVNGPNVIFHKLTLAPKAESVLRLQMLALSTAGPGRHVNRANALDRVGTRLAPEASAAIEIMVEPVFDCGEIIGKVFDDRNGNGYQDEGEPGLPGVRVTTVRGTLITSDAFGRFHVACADLPEARTGSNFIMKLDPRTLPTGYRLTTENPRVVRLTAGKMTKLDFGAALGRVVRLDITDAAFTAGSDALDPQWATGLDELVATLREAPATLRIAFRATDAARAERRIKTLKDDIERRWKANSANYQLIIETRMEASQ